MSSTSKHAMTVKEFCRDHSIGRSSFYELMRDGKGPRSFTVGRKRLIPVEAAAEWRRKMLEQSA
jgi:predicted DNA-binding transcriptional regulator AlpA